MRLRFFKHKYRLFDEVYPELAKKLKEKYG